MPFKIAIDQLEKVEAELGAKLPGEYREAMLLDNGGEGSTKEDDWNFYPLKDASDRKRLSRTCNHIVSETKACSEFGNFPSNALAIAGNGSGDQIVFLMESGLFLDMPYKWFHETGELKELAKSFRGIEKL